MSAKTALMTYPSTSFKFRNFEKGRITVKNTPLLQLEKQDGFCVIDETVSTGQAGACDAYLLLSSDYASLIIKERYSGKFLGAENLLPNQKTGKHFTDFIRQVVESSELLKLGLHRKTTIAINNSFSSLIPSGLFRPGDENASLRFAVSRDDLTALTDKVNGYDLHVVYGVQPEIIALLQELLPGCRILHALSCALEYQAATFSGTKYTTLRVLYFPGQLNIIVSLGKKLLFANTFEVQNSDEALYYLLNTCEQLDIDRAECRATICGAPSHVESLVAKAGSYLAHVHATDDANIGTLSYKLKTIPGSSLLPALTVSLCE